MKTTSLNSILYIRLLFGHYWQCSSSKCVQYLCKFYCFGYISVSMCLYFLLQFDVQGPKAIYDIVLFSFFALNGLFSLWNKQEYFRRFNSRIMTLDKVLKFSTNKSPAIIVFCTLFIIKYTIDAAVNFNYGKTPIIPFCASQMAEMSRNASNLPSVMIFEMLWFRMVHLRTWLSSKFEDGSLQEKQFCLRKFLHLYKTLLDNINNIYKTLAILVILLL